MTNAGAWEFEWSVRHHTASFHPSHWCDNADGHNNTYAPHTPHTIQRFDEVNLCLDFPPKCKDSLNNKYWFLHK